MIKRFSLLISIMCLLGTTASATTIVFNTSNSDDGMGEVYLTDNAIRMSTDDDNWMLFDRSSNTMFFVDDSQREFYVIDEAQIESLGQTLGNVNKQIEEALAALPAGQRAQARAMMESMMPGGGSSGPAPSKDIIEINHTGRSDTIAGVSCDVVETLINNNLEGELCVAETDDLKISNGEMATMRAMGDFAQNMLDTMREHIGSFLPEEFSAGPMIEVLELGVPIRMVNKDSNEISELESISHDDINPDLVRVPVDYQRKPFGPGL